MSSSSIFGRILVFTHARHLKPQPWWKVLHTDRYCTHTQTTTKRFPICISSSELLAALWLSVFQHTVPRADKLKPARGGAKLACGSRRGRGSEKVAVWDAKASVFRSRAVRFQSPCGQPLDVAAARERFARIDKARQELIAAPSPCVTYEPGYLLCFDECHDVLLGDRYLCMYGCVPQYTP